MFHVETCYLSQGFVGWDYFDYDAQTIVLDGECLGYPEFTSKWVHGVSKKTKQHSIM